MPRHWTDVGVVTEAGFAPDYRRRQPSASPLRAVRFYPSVTCIKYLFCAAPPLKRCSTLDLPSTTGSVRRPLTANEPAPSGVEAVQFDLGPLGLTWLGQVCRAMPSMAH